MKKTLKNIIICISILFLILSMCFTIVKSGVTNEYLKIREDPSRIHNSYDDKIADYTHAEISQMCNSSELYILDTYFRLFIISACIGTLIGLFISVKENSIVKYIIFFIFGYALFGLIWTEIAIAIQKHIAILEHSPMIIDRINVFKATAFSFRALISYIIIYAMFVIIIMSYRKNQVKELNDSLKNSNNSKKRFVKNIPIKKIAIVILILITLISVLVITRRTIILINYSKKANELSKNDNYYFKKISSSKDNSWEYKRWRKGDIIVVEYENCIYYINISTKEYLLYSKEAKTLEPVQDTENFDTSISVMHSFSNIFFMGDPSVRYWSSFILALQVSITEEKYNGVNCYVLHTPNLSDGKLYLDKKTYLPIHTISHSYDNSNTYTDDYYYEFGNVTDADVAIPTVE